MTNQLPPCLLCGTDPIIETDSDGWCDITCVGCGFKMGTHTEQMARQLWKAACGNTNSDDQD